MTNDMQRSTRFSYWKCDKEHGKFIRFLDFLKEKNFIRPMSAEEIEALKKAPSSIPAPMQALRARLCEDTGLSEAALPFVGELLQVRDDQVAWRGAIERVLHGFAQSLLVAENLRYPAYYVQRLLRLHKRIDPHAKMRFIRQAAAYAQRIANFVSATNSRQSNIINFGIVAPDGAAGD